MVMKEMEKGGGVFNGFQIQEAETRTLLKQREVLRSASEDLTHSKESCEKDCIRRMLIMKHVSLLLVILIY